MFLMDIPKGSKIICQCSDGSKHIIFDHIDGMYSYCVTERGNVTHLYCMSELEEQLDGSYTILPDRKDRVATTSLFGYKY